MEISCWSRSEWWRNKPSLYELVRLHRELHRHDKFAQVISAYPFWEDTVTRAVKELISRRDYEFFLARLQPSNEIVGWVALSFDIEGNETEGREKFEARLEWTEMCSNILKSWKIDGAGEKTNAWDAIKRASSNLQVKYLPRDYCIINALVLYPQFQRAGVANALLENVINFWRNRVMAGREWAIWVQAPPFAQNLYKRYAFEEVGGYEVDLGDHGFFPKDKRSVFGRYGWKFMVRRDPSGSAIEESGGAPKPDKSKSREEPLKDMGESVAARKLNKGKGKGKQQQQQLDELRLDKHNHPRQGDLSEHAAEQQRAWEEAEERVEEIRLRRGPPPLPREVACLVRIQRRAKEREHNPTSRSKGKGVEQRLEDERPASPGQPPARPLQRNAEVTFQPQDNFTPSKSEEDLIEAMRAGGVDEEEIELVKALTFSLSDETKGG